MARTSATEHTPAASTGSKPASIPAGDHLCAIIGVEQVWNRDQTSWALGITLLTQDGHTGRIDVRGLGNTSGKGPWIERVAGMVAACVAPQFAKVEPKQPNEDFDWESEADLRAVMLGGCLWCNVSVEEGEEKNNGGRWPDKNSVYWPGVAAADTQSINAMRATEKWKTLAPGIKLLRDAAIAEWRMGLERAASGGSANDQVDDAIPF